MTISSLPLIFLSHAGEDQALAIDLGRRIKEALAQAGVAVDVFNTSETQYRFQDLKERLTMGMDWAKETQAWTKELTEYLQSNLLRSAIYVILVTPRSVEKNSPWIAFEMKVASEEAGKRGNSFLPCVTDGALFKMLPAEARFFQGVDLTEQHGFQRMMNAILEVLQKNG